MTDRRLRILILGGYGTFGCNAFEAERDGKFHFHVELSHPWVGLIVRYAGWLEPRAEGSEAPVEVALRVEE